MITITLKPLFAAIKKQLTAARIAKGLTQEEIAEKIGTSKSNISRLESLNNTYTPNMSTLIKYAEMLDMRLEIGLHGVSDKKKGRDFWNRFAVRPLYQSQKWMEHFLA